MFERPEPFLRERVWAHESDLAPNDVRVTGVFDADGRIVGTEYSDGERETYGYDEHGRLITIDEHPQLWGTVAGAANRWQSGGRLVVDYDEQGPLRIVGARGETVWERPEQPWQVLLERGAHSVAERCASALAGCGLDPSTQLCSLRLIYVSDGALTTIVTALTETDRQMVLEGHGAFDVACNLWYPESEPVGFLDIEEAAGDELLLREAAINDPREAQRTVLTEVAKLLARRDWSDTFQPTEDFVVYIAEHDEAFAPKHASVREVNPPERVAAWDARWPAGASRGEDET